MDGAPSHYAAYLRWASNSTRCGAPPFHCPANRGGGGSPLASEGPRADPTLRDRSARRWTAHREHYAADLQWASSSTSCGAPSFHCPASRGVARRVEG